MMLRDIAGSYDAVLLDAYGVLVDASGALPGAAAAVDSLREAGINFFVCTNDASRLPETIADRLSGFGIAVTAAQVLASGQLLAPYIARKRLAGARCLVLGPADSYRYVERAGGRPIAITDDADCDLVAVCDEAGFDFMPTVDATFSAICRRIDAGTPPHLVQPNPDLIYPKRAGSYGFTSGAATLLIEAGLERRYPGAGFRFQRLGKPHPPLFHEAIRRAGSRRLLMVGDQMQTDIAGARRAGLDAALLVGGVTRAEDAHRDPAVAPTYVISSL